MRRFLLRLVVVSALPAAAWAIFGGPSTYCERLPRLEDRNSAIFLGKVLRTGATTVRFQITEAFLNASASELEAELVSDVSINSVPVGLPAFSQGQTWLVETVRHDEGQPWQTGTCTRTKSLQSAGDDLAMLRAWKAGQKLPVKLFGEVFDPKNRKDLPGIPVTFTEGAEVLSTTSDERGRFALEGLRSVRYEGVATLPTGVIRQAVNLTNAWCGQVVFLVK